MVIKWVLLSSCTIESNQFSVSPKTNFHLQASIACLSDLSNNNTPEIIDLTEESQNDGNIILCLLSHEDILELCFYPMTWRNGFFTEGDTVCTLDGLKKDSKVLIVVTNKTGMAFWGVSYYDNEGNGFRFFLNVEADNKKVALLKY